MKAIQRYQTETLARALEAQADVLRQLAEALRGLVDADEESQPKEVLSVVEAADALGVSRSTMYKLLNSGDVQDVRIGGRRMVARSAIKEFLAKGGSTE